MKNVTVNFSIDMYTKIFYCMNYYNTTELHRKTTDKNFYNQLIRKTLMGENMTPTNFYEEKAKSLK